MGKITQMPSKTWALLVHSEAIWMPFEAEHALSRTKATPEMKKQKKLGIKVRDLKPVKDAKGGHRKQ